MIQSSPYNNGHTNRFEITEQRLLQSVVEVARSVFSAAAASIFIIEPETGDLIFTAVAGEGERTLIGTRFQRGTGIAGFVAECGEPMLADDVAQISQFDPRVAESTGYIPHSIMAAPLIRSGECLGVLEILDRASRTREELQDVDLLGLLATQAGIGLEMLMRLQLTRPEDAKDHAAVAALDVLNRISTRLPTAPRASAATALRLLETVDEILVAEE